MSANFFLTFGQNGISISFRDTVPAYSGNCRIIKELRSVDRMAVKHGSLSINSENIFPIIKKWLYSDHDIFVRELVSNGCDAITKLKKLEVMGEYTLTVSRTL